jgi:putative lipoic acid-binding regulatory protein
MTEQTTERGFTFPTTLEVSAMGASDAGLLHIVPDVLAGVGVDVIAGSLRQRP